MGFGWLKDWMIWAEFRPCSKTKKHFHKGKKDYKLLLNITIIIKQIMVSKNTSNSAYDCINNKNKCQNSTTCKKGQNDTIIKIATVDKIETFSELHIWSKMASYIHTLCAISTSEILSQLSHASLCCI